MARTPVAWRPGDLVSPLQIAGCVVWCDASQLPVVADGTAVQTWTDQAGGAMGNPTQLIVANRPTYVSNQFNGKPVMRFNGTSQGYGTANAQSTVFPSGQDSPCTFLIAARLSSQSALVYYATLGSNQVNLSAFAPACTVGTNVFAVIGTKTTSYSDLVAPITSPHVVTHVHNAGAFCANSAAYLNGTRGTAAGSATGFSISLRTFASGFAIGANSSDGAFSSWFPGDIAELILYNRALGDGERKAVEQYLGQKYGITVAP